LPPAYKQKAGRNSPSGLCESLWPSGDQSPDGPFFSIRACVGDKDGGYLRRSLEGAPKRDARPSLGPLPRSSVSIGSVPNPSRLDEESDFAGESGHAGRVVHRHGNGIGDGAFRGGYPVADVRRLGVDGLGHGVRGREAR